VAHCRHPQRGANTLNARFSEAIDRRARVRLPLLARQLAVGCHDGGCQIHGAGVLPAWSAQPDLRLAVVVLRLCGEVAGDEHGRDTVIKARCRIM
jgi:hypothetical protein